MLVANATVFAYRWFSGALHVYPANMATGAACTGFYTSVGNEFQGIPLPPVGTNAFAPVYGNVYLQPTVGRVVCQFTHNGNTYPLYESVSFEFNITVGNWYFKDIYGFGYWNPGGPTVYVFLKVEDTVTVPEEAKLIVYKGNNYVGELNLKNLGDTLSVTLNHGEALRLDIRISSLNYSYGGGGDTFRIGFYVSQENESP